MKEKREMPQDVIRVLFVDDEPSLLDGMARQLHRYFTVITATSGEEGLSILANEEPFAVVVSDMRMPGMNGATFLGKAKEISPDSVRMLLTGYADMESAVAAVNEGNIFRFLTKPCPPILLGKVLQDAVRQHKLITAEKVLLEKTLHGCIKALTDVLALANPLIFSRATRAKRHVGEIAEALDLPNRWEIEIAAMLSQIACIALPPNTAEKAYYSRPLEANEQLMVKNLPVLTKQILSNIPRLEPIEELLDHLESEEVLSQAGSALRLALDYDTLETSGLSSQEAIQQLRAKEKSYDEAVLECFIRLRKKKEENQELPLDEIKEGMIFGESLMSSDGRLLVAFGQEATAGLLARLKNVAKSFGMKETLIVISQEESR